ncbi:hypothetical protein [Hymenobacter sp. B1770]|uniref:hypothetical protein n=1 Tax=Hymenobacter sp. B1770 TaxID=1718788 RepID=UPI003CF0905C
MKTKTLLLLLLGVLLLAVLNWKWPFLRFTNHWTNDVFAVLVAALPVLLLVGLIGRITKAFNRWVAWPLTGVLVVVAVPFMAILVFKFTILAFELIAHPPHANDQDGGFEQVAQLDEHMAVYRTNGGATTAYGIVVRQERPLVPGVLLVRNVFAQYRLENVACQLTGPRLTIRHPSSGQVLKEVTLKRFFYF